MIGYFLTALALFGVQAIAQKVPLSHIFGYFSYFYILVMVIEPKTSPASSAGQFIFGAAAAILIFILTARGARFDVELFSLLMMNMSVPLINKAVYKKGGRQ